MKNQTKEFLKNIGFIHYNEIKQEYSLSIIEPNCFTIKIPNEIINSDEEITLVFQYILKEIIAESVQKGIRIGKITKAKEIKDLLYIPK